jgi:glycosyltransferase involved in cell wall biosynthesis
VSEEYWPEGAGGTLATHLVVEFLARVEDCQLTVVSGTPRPSRTSDVRYVYTPLLAVANKLQLWNNLVVLGRHRWFIELVDVHDVVYIPRYCYPTISLAKRRGKTVIVHLHDYLPISFNAAVPYGYTSGFFANLKNIIDTELFEHDSALRAFLSSCLLPVNALSRRWLAEADRIICVSQKQCRIITAAAPELRAQTRVLYNLMPSVRHAEKAVEAPRILYLGGDSYLKGFHVFLRASIGVLDKRQGVQFLLTRHYAARRRLFERLNTRFPDAYQLVGFLPHDALLRLHAKSAALLFPSIWEEPLPYVLMESMLAGTLPVASDIGGVPEMVEGTYAQRLLFQPGNVEQLAESLDVLFSLSREQLCDIGCALRANAMKKFDPRPIRAELVKLMQP